MRSGNDAGIEKEFDHLGNPPKVFFPFGETESQVPAQAVADVIAIEDIGSAAHQVQPLLHRVGEG